jgi:hypothetical protein
MRILYCTTSLAFLIVFAKIPSLTVCLQEETVAEQQSSSSSSEFTYGLDVSFPIHDRVSTNYPWLPHNVDPDHNEIPVQFQNKPIQVLGDRQDLYLQHVEGCRNHYAPDNSPKCDWYEWNRLLRNRRQPQSILNLTETGWKKIRAPSHLKELIDDFWETNKDKDKAEEWGVGNTYFNSWESPTTLVSVDDKGLRGSGPKLKEELWAASSAVAEEWTQQELQPCSLYGIRVYHEGSIMMPHVDSPPLIVSAMYNVAQDTDEPWPLEIYEHNGLAVNITLDPGDLLLFETASVIHGHPFPLKGRYYASIFLHFEPTGREYQEVDGHYLLRDGRHPRSGNSRKDVNKQYHAAIKAGLGGPTASLKDGLPPYIKRESPEEAVWREQHPEGWRPVSFDLSDPFSHFDCPLFLHLLIHLVDVVCDCTAIPAITTRSTYCSQVWGA